MSESQPRPTVIDLLRHAECEGGAIFRGTTDVALSVAGWARLDRVAAAQPDWQRVFTSPLVRCRAFADWLAEARGLPLTEDAGWREMSFGDWEGRGLADVWQEQAEIATAWWRDPASQPPPGGDAYETVQRRARAAFDAVAAAAPGEHSVCLTHGALIRILLCDILCMPSTAMARFDVPYGCLTRIEISAGPDGQPVCRLSGHNIGPPEPTTGPTAE